MRKLIFVFLFLSLSNPLVASKPMSVAQLEQLVNQLHDSPDKDASQRLAACKLTERLSTVRLDRLQESLPGERSRSALLAVADVSAFLPLPPADLATASAPDSVAQKAMLSRAVDFVLATTAQMPDFLAQKRTSRFQDTRFGANDNDPVIVTPDLYHLIDSKVVPVRYRNGREEIDSSSAQKQDETGGPAMGLTTSGIFGPMLQTVMRDILKGKIGWSHWEQSPSGPVAVFRYFVPKEQATFTLTWCCAAGLGTFRDQLQAVPKYHGEISVNPESGVVTRMVIIADVDAGQPVSTADVFVEYSPVDIGGKTYVCPARSATLLVAKSPVEHGITKNGAVLARDTMDVWHDAVDNFNVTSISDSRFVKYHVFRSEMRIVEH